MKIKPFSAWFLPIIIVIFSGLHHALGLHHLEDVMLHNPGTCPFNWDPLEFICYRESNEHHDFKEAIRFCMDDDFENYPVRGLIPTRKLRHFYNRYSTINNVAQSYDDTRSHHSKHRGFFDDSDGPFRINALKDHHDVWREYPSGRAIQLSHFPDFDHEWGHVGDTLIWFPKTDHLHTASAHDKYRSLCYRPKQNVCPRCEGSTIDDHECHDAGYCVNGECHCDEDFNLPELHCTSSKIFDWGYQCYNGADTWPAYFHYCGGRSQSPINFDSDTVEASSLAAPILSGDYANDLDGTLTNNGHTIVFTPDDASAYTLSDGDETYTFLQMHFHWGSNDSLGSEHTLDNQAFPLELHMVHINNRYLDDTSQAFTNEMGLAVLGFWFEAGSSGDFATEFEPFSDGIEALTAGQESVHMDSRSTRDVREAPAEPKSAVDAMEGSGIAQTAPVHKKLAARAVAARALAPTESHETTVNLNDYIGAVTTTAFYHYMGSLTTPTCNEVVSWVVFADPIPIDPVEIAKLRTLIDSHDYPMVDNFRPTQPINGRLIQLNA